MNINDNSSLPFFFTRSTWKMGLKHVFDVYFNIWIQNLVSGEFDQKLSFFGSVENYLGKPEDNFRFWQKK